MKLDCFKKPPPQLLAEAIVPTVDDFCLGSFIVDECPPEMTIGRVNLTLDCESCNVSICVSIC